MSDMEATPVRLETLTPFHYQSLAIPSGVATLSTHLADRSVVYGLASALGALSAGVALPEKNYRRDLARLPWMASVFEAETPRLMRPRGRRLNLDGEGGYAKQVQDATGTGNLKTWFFIQEVPQGAIYHGAVFGEDPFNLASQAADEDISEVVFRIGRHRGGIVRLTRAEVPSVRLNLHTGFICGRDINRDIEEDANAGLADGMRLRSDLYALWDLQFSAPLDMDRAAQIAGVWARTVRGLEGIG
ncbi:MULTISPECIES: hypothetical protein [Rhodobacterales]|uniref:hypothetical protein n=1 Tax=Rhodobacterales TaxID=204455 RepID=UPI001109D10B|nr:MULTISPECIES: hypothetical protein [Rhodobacterales]